MKRIVWTTVGYSLGLGSSVWVQRRVRRTVERYAPAQVRSDLAERGRHLAVDLREAARDVHEAARDGAEMMRQVEHDLLEEFSPRRSVASAGPTNGLRPVRPRR